MTIPVISMKDFYRQRSLFVRGLREAFRKVGFVGITDTPITPCLLERVYADSKRFFEMEASRKEEISGQKIGGERGYTGSSESPVGKKVHFKDSKEFIHFGRELTPLNQKRLGYPLNKWSRYVNMKPSISCLYNSLSEIVQPLAETIEEAIDAPSQTLQKMVKEGDHLLRVVRYPGDLAQGVEGAAPHVDSNLYTILPPATSSGLEVFLNHTWTPVIAPKGAVIVNGGTMLEHMTNGYFRSALHRVIKYENGGPDRYSTAYFVHSRENDPMTPLSSCIAKTGGVQKYPSATRQYLLYQRLFAMGRTTPKMERQFLSWGAIKRWKKYVTPNDPRKELIAELEKVSYILHAKK